MHRRTSAPTRTSPSDTIGSDPATGQTDPPRGPGQAPSRTPTHGKVFGKVRLLKNEEECEGLDGIGLRRSWE